MYNSETIIHIKKISFKIISLLVLFALNLYNKTFVVGQFFWHSVSNTETLRFSHIPFFNF